MAEEIVFINIKMPKSMVEKLDKLIAEAEDKNGFAVDRSKFIRHHLSKVIERRERRAARAETKG